MMKTGNCALCNAEFTAENKFGEKKYCSVQCKKKTESLKRREPFIELPCGVCSKSFMANRGQHTNHERGLKICCSIACRNRINGRRAKKNPE